MPRNKTHKEDISNSERYFNKWLAFRKLDFFKEQHHIEDNEVSITQILENDDRASLLTDRFAEQKLLRSEASDSRFSWMELFENAQLYDACMSLTERQKLILTYWLDCNLTDTQIALIMGITPQSVFVMKKRIIEKFKKIFVGV